MIPYTNINIGLIGVALSLKAKRSYPILFANSAAILAAFYTGLYLDKTASRRLMQWGNYNRLTFTAYDFLGHVVPVIVMGALARPRKRSMNPGMYSLLLHLAWLGYVNRDKEDLFDLSHVYVHMTQQQWRVIWLAGFAAHLCAVPALKVIKGVW